MTAAKDIFRVLEGPQRYHKLLREIDMEIDRVRAGFEAGSPSLSFAPGGGGGKRDLSVYYCRVEDLIKCRKAAYDRYGMSVQKVLQVLDGCENKTAKRLLQLVYVGGLTRAQAAEMCGVSYDCAYTMMRRQIMRLAKIYQCNNGEETA